MNNFSTNPKKKKTLRSPHRFIMKSWKELGVNLQTYFACEHVGWKNPTKIQVEAIPVALEGNDDLVGLAPTGSGKTGAFAIPILQALLKNPNPFFACVISPTRERAIQVADQFKALGVTIGLRCALLVEGVDGVDDFVQQAIVLGKWPQPHIVVATPDRLVKHLCNTNVFSLRMLKFLVVDEADRFIDDDFVLVDEILNVIPSQRPRIFLFSATMSEEVKTFLQRACLLDHAKIVAASKYTLRQHVQEAKGKSQMKIKEGGGKKRRKGDEDDARNRQAWKKKHHPGPRPLTKLANTLMEKMDEIKLPPSPIKECMKDHGRGSYSYKLVYPDGTTLSVRSAPDLKERGPLPAASVRSSKRGKTPSVYCVV